MGQVGRSVSSFAEAIASDGLSLKIGVADGLERWPTCEGRVPSQFGTAARTARQLAEMARGGQVVMPVRLKNQFEAQLNGDGFTSGEALTVPMDADPGAIDVVAFARTASQAHVWHFPLLRASLEEFVGLTARAVEMVHSVDGSAEDYGHHPEIGSRWLHSIKGALNLLSRDQLGLRAAIDRHPQLRRLPKLAANVESVIELKQRRAGESGAKLWRVGSIGTGDERVPKG